MQVKGEGHKVNDTVEYIPHGMASHNDWLMLRGSDGHICLLHPKHHQHPVCWQVCQRHYL